MKSDTESQKQRRQSRSRIAASLLLVLLAGFFSVPDAEAQITCGGGPFATTEPIDLLSCSEYKPNQSTAASVDIPAGIAVGDLLVTIVQIDDGNNNATLSDDSGYWAPLAAVTEAEGIDSQVFYDQVGAADLALAGTSTQFSWTGGNERFYAIVLHLRGARATFDFGAGINLQDESTPPAPQITTIVDNTFVLRTISLDRRPINEDISGMAGHTDIALDNSGNGNGAITGGATYIYQASPATLPEINWVLTSDGDGSHTRSIGIRPAPEFRFSMPDTTAPVCGIQSITIDVTDANGNILDYYTGTIDITATNSTGAIWAESGAGSPGILTDTGNGTATYQFVAGDNGTVTLDYSNPNLGVAVNFDADDQNGFFGQSTAVGYTSPTLNMVACTPSEIRIAHSTQSDVCSREAVTISIADVSGNVDTSFTGTITVTTSALAGTWTVSDATNALVDNGGGSVDYTFDVADGGDIILFYELPIINGAVDFNVTTTTPDVSPPSGADDPILDIAGCTVDIQVDDGAAELCEAGESVTYTIRDRFGAIATDYAGILILNNDTANGDYSPAGENGTFDNGTSGDGIATYTYDSADNGVLTVTFTNDTAETANLTASSSGITLDGGSDVGVVFNACEFRIAYTDGDAGLTDVCSVEQVRIGLYNSVGSVVTGYTGTINLSTTTGNGTWSDTGGSALGTLIDPVSADGNATYSFVAGDNGEITLDFVDLINETTNINVTDGTTSDPGDNMDPNDPDLTVDLCTFEISYDGGATSNDGAGDACTIQQVTITVRDRLGNIDTDYVGTVNLSTTTNNGNWSDPGNAAGQPQGTLADVPGDDDGAATYTFALADNGQATLEFSNLNTETTNVDLVDGVIVEDGLADPDLVISSCVPSINDQSCVAGASPLTTALTIGAQSSSPSLQGRMVVVATAMEGDGDVSGVTFNGVAMTQIYDERIDDGAFDNNTELWGILDTNLPANTTPTAYNAAVTHTDTDALAMCAFFLDDVEQAFPAADLGTPSNGQVNGSQADTDTPASTNPASTSITTTQNNAYVMSIVSNGSSGDYNSVSPSPPIVRIFNGPDPSSGVFAGSGGVAPVAALIAVDETASVGTPNRFTHIVAAFNPLITGPPLAIGYEPVVLIETYSGAISYRAIGNTFRNAANPTSCSFDTTSSATLTLPNEEPLPAGFDSTVESAYLYWFASGDDNLGQVDANVTFTDPSLTATNITADDIFLITGVGSGGVNDYFAGYKDVTPLVTGNGTYTLSNLTIQNGAPWSNTQACAGGWAMVVVYSNPFEQLRVINLFHGFQPFQNSAFTLVPRNFRMAVPDDARDLPNGQVTHITVEGDETLFNGDESLQIQDAPGGTTYSPLVTYYNPLQAEFNGTVTRPLYQLVDVDPPNLEQYYLFDASQGAGGYEIDFPGADVGDEIPGAPDPAAGDQIGGSFGVDIDTHYISGDGDTDDGDSDYLNLFAIAEAEEITTRYSSGQDLVLLVSEVISITNAPIADLEMFVNEVGTFKVDGTGTYQYVVTNNGNGAPSFGSATGEIKVSNTLPAGMTFANAGDVSGDGWVCSVTLDPGAFTCTFDIANDWTLARGAQVAGELGESATSGVGESLPTISALVQVGNTTFFPLLSNDAKNVARLLHSGGSCAATSDGVSPDPSLCVKSPEFDNVNDLQGGTIDINDLDDKTTNNNNVASTTTEVRGIETDLSIDKFVNGVLEEGGGVGAGQYTIRVTNTGPDTTTAGFSISDNDPPFVTFVSVVADSDWNCTTITPTLSCQYIGAAGIAPLGTKDLVLNVTVDGAAGDIVTNTVVVATGPFNFDSNSSNDSDTDITAIVAPPVGGVEKFLLTVSTAAGGGGPTDLDGLDSFDDQDLVLYDPLLDVATLFFDHSATAGASINDANAVHLLPNGQFILSANASSTLGGQAFEPEDLVRYDPISNTATLIFDGSAIFADAGENIDAVYVLDNGNLVISTTADAAIGGTSFDKSDLIEYDVVGGTATVRVDGSDTDVFGAADLTQVDAAYIRVDPTDATATVNTYALSTDDVSANIGQDPGYTPAAGTDFSRDDVTELNRNDNSSQNLFLGNIPLGVFTDDDTGAPDPQLRLDGLHIIEDAYLGHFAISESQAGNTCSAGKVTITKHQGLTHNVDTDYFGSVLLTTSSGTGTWGIETGSGILVDAVPNDGQATYTFVPSDNGDVVLSLSINTVTADVNVDVTNGFVEELASEDPDLDFNTVVTVVTYRDEFTSAVFTNNDGSTGWSTSWSEEDDADGVNGGNSGAGVGAGNVRISGGELSFTSNPATDVGGRDPSLRRDADLSVYNATETFLLNFDYRYVSLNSADSFVIEVSDDNGANWTAFPAYTGLSGTAGPISASLNVSTLGGSIDDFSNTMSVRFRVNNGYTLSSTFYVDNVELKTGTTDCGIGLINHYAIEHNGVGIQCLGSEITIIGHDANHFETAVPLAEVMSMTAFNGTDNRGSWVSILSGAGVLSDLGAQGAAGNTDGVGSYTWPGNESRVTLRFNYTGPLISPDPNVVNFNLGGSYAEIPAEDPNLNVSLAGLRFFNETDQLTGIPVQIAGKPSNQYAADKIITLQALRTSDNDVSACENLFANGATVTIEFAAECDDPSTCAVTAPAQEFTVNGTPITLADQNGSSGASAYEPVSVTFANQTTSTGVPLVLNYSDAGEVELHARYDIAFNNDVDFPITSEDYLVGAENLVVRPFGLDIDFSDDRSGGGSNSRSNDLTGATGPAFAKAGESFATTVTARRWQAADDADEDGVPDSDANLTDNATTPNFGNESTAIENDVELTHTLAGPVGGVTGTLTGGTGFTGFTAGVSNANLSFSEVGIINLTANLADNNYLGSGADIQGNVVNLGRFYPDNFNLRSAVTSPVYNSDSPFTYMGQEFDTSFVMEARNSDNVITQNYVGDFVRIDGSSFDPDNVFHGVVDNNAAADDDLSSRATSVDGSFSTIWDPIGGGSPGTGTISGKMIFQRQNLGGNNTPEDGPFTVAIGTSVQDTDSVAITLSGADIDVDDGTTEPGTSLYRRLTSTDIEFRYGRMLVDNAFGPETEELGVPLRIEYWNGTDFVINTDDSATSFLFDISASPPALGFVGTSYQADAGVPDPLTAGDIAIEQGALVDVTVNLFNGITGRLQDGDADDENDPDRPFLISAPDPLAANGTSGRVMIEFDLNSPSLPFSLDFLSYDWRGDAGEVDDYDEIPDGSDYSDNPRGVIEFGSYRGHDRIRSWREI